MLLGKSYEEAFNLLHPGKKMSETYSHGWSALSMEDKTHELLRGLGFKTHSGKYRKFKSYQDRVKKNAIMIIRWDFDPTMCHCILFDADAKQFIEPSGGYVILSPNTLKSLQRQLDTPIIIDRIPTSETLRDLHRSAPTDRLTQREDHVGQDTRNQNGQVPILPNYHWGLGTEGSTSDIN
jgi:hypothetical protein